MRLTYLSHSCFLVETSSHRLIIDPFLNGNPLAKTKPEEVECDFILVTHGHEDHLGDAIAIAKRTGATILANYEIATYCGRQGVKNARPINPGGAWNAPFGRVKFTTAHHSSSISTPDGGFLYLGNPCGIVIEADGKTLYHAGDTALFLDMKLIGELHQIDVAMLPIGDDLTMGMDDAVRAIGFLDAKLAIPMHYNTFDIIKLDPHEFVRKAEAAGRVAKVMEVNEPIDLE